MRLAVAAVCLSFLCLGHAALLAEQVSTVLTVYSARVGEAESSFAWVEERRTVQITRGHNRLLWEALPREVQPGSIRLAVEGDRTKVHPLAQTFFPGIAEGQTLLPELVGQSVRIEPRPPRGRLFEGTLLQATPQVTLRDAQGLVHIFPEVSRVEVSSPETLSLQPKVAWDIEAEQPGVLPVVARYETSGLTWRAEYIATLNPGAVENEGQLQLAGAFLVENGTTVSWSNAQLNLVAGDVRRPFPGARPQTMLWQREVAAMAKANDSSERHPLGEYYEYELSRPVTLPAKATVRLEALGVFSDVPYEQEFLCRNTTLEALAGRGTPVTEREPGAGRALPVEVLLRFRNTKEARLGVPLPGGVLRVGQTRGKGPDAWRFLGGGELPHTAEGEEVVLPLGSAFDVIAVRKEKDFLLESEQRRMEETVSIELRNHKERPVRVRVLETLYRAQQWEITESQPRFAKKDARTVEFKVNVPAKGGTSVTYRVRYTW